MAAAGDEGARPRHRNDGSGASAEAGPSRATSPDKRPSGFGPSEDYIAFDFGEDDAEQDQSAEERAAAPFHRRDGIRGGQTTGASRASSPKAQGKKRKIDVEEPADAAGSRRRDGQALRITSPPATTSQMRKKERRQLARGTPWCVDVEFQRCRTAIEMLHDELIAFADWISPTRQEHETRRLVIHLIRLAIQSQFPDADIQPFGSQNTQLYMPQGDIDLVVISRRMETQRREGVLRSMAACLRRHNLATDVQVIAKAKVPIIKFVCTHGKLKVDISVNQTNGLDAADFVCGWLDRCPSVRPLIMATKLLLSQRGMSEVFSGGLGSYSVICMVISHIQLHPKVQRRELDPALNLGVLFLEFLELFGKNFGYDEVGISIAGKGGYFRKAARGWKDDRRPFMLCIEDPQDAGNDISKGSFSILNVRQVFGGAFDILSAALCQREVEMQEGRAFEHWRDDRNGRHKRFHVDEDELAREALVNGARNGEGTGSEKDPQSLLGSVLGVNYEMTKARRDLEGLWQSGSLQAKVGRTPPPRSPEPSAHSQGHRRQRELEREREKASGSEGKREHPMDDRRRDTRREGSPRSEGAGARRPNGKSSTFRQAGPEVIIASRMQNDERGRRQTAGNGNANAARSAVADVISISSSAQGSDDEEDVAWSNDSDDELRTARDSRYSSAGVRNERMSDANGVKAKRPSRLDAFSRLAPETYVVESDDDDEGDLSARPDVARRTDESGTSASSSVVAVSPSKPGGRKKQRGGSKKRSAGESPDTERDAKASRKAAFWASKGNAAGGQGGDDDQADDRVMLNIYD